MDNFAFNWSKWKSIVKEMKNSRHVSTELQYSIASLNLCSHMRVNYFEEAIFQVMMISMNARAKYFEEVGFHITFRRLWWSWRQYHTATKIRKTVEKKTSLKKKDKNLFKTPLNIKLFENSDQCQLRERGTPKVLELRMSNEYISYIMINSDHRRQEDKYLLNIFSKSVLVEAF